MTAVDRRRFLSLAAACERRDPFPGGAGEPPKPEQRVLEGDPKLSI
jgi:hypothetical protein